MLLNYITTFEGTARDIREIKAARGESFQLTATITNMGQNVNLNDYLVYALYQPSSDVGVSNTYRSLQADTDEEGRAVITWTEEAELQSCNYRIWLQTIKDNQISYPAVWELHLIGSPGADPNVTPPIQPGGKGTDIVYSQVLAPEFNSETEYSVGQLVSYQGWLYVVANNHLGEWNEEDFTKTTIAELVNSINNKV